VKELQEIYNKKYDYLIVGAGLFGSVCAKELTDKGFSCLVIDKRNHIGGNCYTEKIEGINVHKYGPHIFHTSNERVWEYVNKFIKFNNYKHHGLANYKGELYSLPFNMFTYNKLWNVNTPEEAKNKIESQKFRGEPTNLEESALSQVGYEIYEKLIKGYTIKQWMKDPKELPSFIIKRLPVRFTYDNNYYFDKYQGIPENGYTELFEKLLEGIKVILNIDFFEHQQKLSNISNHIIYTGPIDKFFNYKFGHLEYRPLRFETEIFDDENHQGHSIINYTEETIPYTRIIEHKHFENSNSNKTVVTKEFPLPFSPDLEPYYPINDKINNELLSKYQNEISHLKNVTFGGRLAEYKYYDMHQIIENALITVDNLTKKKTLVIHNPLNCNTRHYRDYNLFFDDLTDELKKKYKVIENRETQEPITSYTDVYLKSSTNPVKMLECEYIIEDQDTEEFYILSVAEQLTHCVLTQQDNPKLKKVLYSQYIPDQMVHHCGVNSNKYYPWIFFPQDVVDLENYYEKRKTLNEFNEKMFFRGNTQYRPIINYINPEILSNTNKTEFTSYFDELISHEVCLSIGGVANGDLCYRDIECMALGIPILRFDFVTTLNPALIPNYHYISIPLQLDLPKHRDVLKDRLGNENHAKLIEKRYHEIINNKNLLKFISNNGRNYYEKYLSKESRVKHTLNLLNL
jgi:UDP-galactopyranose mutase